MGQLVLGFRSLIIRFAIFFVMAGLLAWALGGTLFPKPTVVNLPGAGQIHWKVSSGGEIHGLQWSLMKGSQELTIGHWQSVVGPVIVDGVSWIATGNASQWTISKVEGSEITEDISPPSWVLSELFPSNVK